MGFGDISIWALLLIMAIIVFPWGLISAARKYFATSTSYRSSATSRSDHSTSSFRTHYDNLQVAENASI
jgi:hypothetical protein